ncbi:PR domain-containing protein 11-like [Plakobranchus ocellatus]|uniref:PR domain-containing protein 11-like n=1 Tax=Plakobranchus ocellatus TaxID=259542 RepID=A0AAV4BLF4_9GAST|nr:PR domain-containing protein 11-like [Plakobranchus ocellatus]
MLRDGSFVRSDGGLIMFTRLKDGKYVGFRDDQIDMKALEEHIANASSRATGSPSGTPRLLNLNKQSLDLPCHVLSQTSSLSQTSNVTLPQSPPFSQSHALASVASVSSSLPVSSPGSSPVFGQLQLSLQDMAGVKNFIPGLSLDQHQQANQGQQLSPSCDKDLQSFAELVSSTLEQEEQEEMQVEFSQTQEQTQLQRQQSSKPADNVRISLSPLGQSTFHIDMERGAPDLLPHSCTLSPTSSSKDQRNEVQHSFGQHHQTLAPIQTLLNSLRQKGDRPGSSHQASSPVFTSSHFDLTGEADLVQHLDIQHKGIQQKPVEIEAFLKSVAYHLEQSQNDPQLGSADDYQVPVLQMDKRDQQQQQQQQPHQQLQQSHLKQATHLSYKPVGQMNRVDHLGMKLAQGSQNLNPPPGNSKVFSEIKKLHSMPPTNSQNKPLINALQVNSPLSNARPASSPAINSNISDNKGACLSSTPPVISDSPSKFFNSKISFPLDAISSNVNMFVVDTPTIFTSGSNSGITSVLTHSTNSYSARATAKNCPTLSDSSMASSLALVSNPSLAVPDSGACTDKSGSDRGMRGTKAMINPAFLTSKATATVTANLGSSNSGNNSSTATTTSSLLDNTLGDQIWMNLKTPHARLMDKKATQALIHLVRQPHIRAKLASNHTKKKEVWNEIGQDMKKQGFVFGNAGEKCSQKWHNMEQTFKDYELSKHIPSLKHKKQPDFYTELSALLKGKEDYKAVMDEDNYKKKMVVSCTDGTGSLGKPDTDSHAFCDLITKSTFSSEVPKSHSSCNLKTAPVSKTVVVSSLHTASSITTPLSVTPVMSATCKASSLKPSALESTSSHSSLPPSGTDDKTSSRTETLEREVKHLQGLVQTQSKEIQRMSEVLASVQSLLKDQRRDSEAVRAESGRRFSELKALIGQNQREKMKFMCDFLRAIKPARQPKRIKSQLNSGNQGSA